MPGSSLKSIFTDSDSFFYCFSFTLVTYVESSSGIFHLFLKHYSPMLADPTHVLAEMFDVYIPETGVAERGSFVVNPEGRIICAEVNDGAIGRNAAELLRRVQASQFVAEHGDAACPASWVPGAEVLHPGIDLVGKL